MKFQRKEIIIFCSIGIAVVIALFWYLKSWPFSEKVKLEQVYEKAGNPVKGNLPQTNPFSIKTNPFVGLYKNPFNR